MILSFIRPLPPGDGQAPCPSPRTSRCGPARRCWRGGRGTPPPAGRTRPGRCSRGGPGCPATPHPPHSGAGARGEAAGCPACSDTSPPPPHTCAGQDLHCGPTPPPPPPHPRPAPSHAFCCARCAGPSAVGTRPARARPSPVPLSPVAPAVPSPATGCWST